MNLLQHLVNVDRVGLAPLLLFGGFLGASSGHAFLSDLFLGDGDALTFRGHCGVEIETLEAETIKVLREMCVH